MRSWEGFGFGRKKRQIRNEIAARRNPRPWIRISDCRERKTNMTARVQSLTGRPARKALEAHHDTARELHLRNLFADDPKRGERMTAEAAGIFLDYSKNRFTEETLKLLLQLAEDSGLRD